jgi:hypothetical protein
MSYQNILKITQKTNVLFLLIIGFIGFFIRLYYIPFDLPLVNDALVYFLYAFDFNQLGHLPNNWAPVNNGWSVLVGIFFHILPSESSVMTLMNTQRLLAVTISCITIIPVYFLCKKFFKPKFAILGATLFVLDPRLIQNSILGITEPLYFLFSTFSLFLILRTDKRSIYLSFILASLATLVRAEGLFIFITISILFFIKNRKDKKIALHYPIIVIIFVLIIFPMSMYRTEINGGDGIFQRVEFSVHDSSSILSEDTTGGIFEKISNTFEIYLKYLGWIMIPNFILFVPVGIILTLRQRDFQTVFIIITGVLMSLPAIAAYFVPYFETRYLYILFPVFSLLSLLTIQKLIAKRTNQNLILSIIIICIIIVSVSFLELKKNNFQHEEEAYKIAKDISYFVKGVNQYYPESEYLKAVVIPEKPILSSLMNKIEIIPTNQYNSLEDYIKNSKDKGLTHLVIDMNDDRKEFLKQVYFNEKSYPYLQKVYDSKDENYTYSLKVFEINYDKFDCITNKTCT